MLSRDVQERFRRLAARVVSEGLPSAKSWISDEWRQAAGAEKGARIFRYWSAIALGAGLHPAGRDCLDAGCGAGLLTVILALTGVRRVLAVDVLPQAVRVVREAVRLGELPGVEVVQGDIASLSPAAGPFDLAYSIEAISHYRDHHGFLRCVQGLLKPGGALIIRDANNGANPATVRRTQELWRATEFGCAEGRCHGHACTPEGLLGARRSILREALPELSLEQADQYARWTFGYNRERTIEAGRLPPGPQHRLVLRAALPPLSPGAGDA